MRRHLFIIINDGGMGNFLPNVKKDKLNYYQFFNSSEGGAWEEDEISVYDNNFNFNNFSRQIRFQKDMGEPYDYMVIVFCGHGYSDRRGERWIEIRPEDTQDSCVSVSQIRDVCYGIRTLFISDSCAAIPRSLREENSGIGRVNLFSGDNSYRIRCRSIYDAAVMNTSEYSFTAGYAVSLEETAGENERGGIYSQTLLDVARGSIKELRRTDNEYASFSYVHSLAADIVVARNDVNQHPAIEMSRSRYQFPFVVAPLVL